VLRRGEREGEARHERPHGVAVHGVAVPLVDLLQPPPAHQHAQLEDEQLVEREPPPRRLGLGQGGREVEGPQRPPPRQQPVPAARLLGQELRHLLPAGGQRVVHDGAEHAGREPLRGGVDGDDAARVQRVVGVAGEDLELLHRHHQRAEALHAAVDDEPRPAPDQPPQVPLAEPGALQDPAAVGDRGLELVRPDPPLAEGHDRALGGLFLAGRQVGDRGEVPAVLVPVGAVVQEIPHGGDAQPGQLRRARRADAFHVLHRSEQDGGVGGTRRASGDHARQTSTRHHPFLAAVLPPGRDGVLECRGCVSDGG